MFIPFLAAASVATAFAQLGAMSVKIGVLAWTFKTVSLAFLADGRRLLVPRAALERPNPIGEWLLSVFSWYRAPPT